MRIINEHVFGSETGREGAATVDEVVKLVETAVHCSAKGECIDTGVREPCLLVAIVKARRAATIASRTSNGYSTNRCYSIATASSATSPKPVNTDALARSPSKRLTGQAEAGGLWMRAFL